VRGSGFARLGPTSLSSRQYLLLYGYNITAQVSTTMPCILLLLYPHTTHRIATHISTPTQHITHTAHNTQHKYTHSIHLQSKHTHRKNTHILTLQANTVATTTHGSPKILRPHSVRVKTMHATKHWLLLKCSGSHLRVVCALSSRALSGCTVMNSRQTSR